MTQILIEKNKDETLSDSINQQGENMKVKNSKSFSHFFHINSFEFFQLCSFKACLLRVCTDIVCLKHSISTMPSNFINLCFFIISLLGLVFTLMFIVQSLLQAVKNWKLEFSGEKFDVAFCILWSTLYGVFTTLFLIFNNPMMISVVCGYTSMICYASDSYCRHMKNKKLCIEFYHVSSDENELISD